MPSRFLKFGRFLDHHWSTTLLAGSLTYYICKYELRFLSFNPSLARIRVADSQDEQFFVDISSSTQRTHLVSRSENTSSFFAPRPKQIHFSKSLSSNLIPATFFPSSLEHSNLSGALLYYIYRYEIQFPPVSPKYARVWLTFAMNRNPTDPRPFLPPLTLCCPCLHYYYPGDSTILTSIFFYSYRSHPAPSRCGDCVYLPVGNTPSTACRPSSSCASRPF